MLVYRRLAYKKAGRGKLCKHFQCFDLERYISLNSKKETATWKCPHCKKRSVELIRDVLFEKISETYAIRGVAPQLKISFGEKAGECRVERENVTEIFSLNSQNFVSEK